MNQKDLLTKIARLESALDQRESELLYMNELLKQIGFPLGLESVKHVAEEILEGYEDGEF